MALSADKVGGRNTKTADGYGFEVGDTVAVYRGSIMAAGHSSNATAAKRGRVSPWTGAVGEIPGFGFSPWGVTGDASATPPTKATLQLNDFILYKATVTGVTAVTDQFKLVYASDDDTLTLTAQTNRPVPCGVIVRWYTSTTCDVLMFGAVSQAKMALNGSCYTTMHLGNFLCASITAGAGPVDIRTGHVLSGHGEFVSVWAMIGAAIVGAGGAANINLEIGGTNVTGGVVALAEADAVGAKKSGSAVSGAAEFHDGDLLDVEASSVVAMTAGTFDLYARVKWHLGV
jgi:hypothetical protein